MYARTVDLGLLILRLGFGLGFLHYHGWDKIVGGPERWEALGGAMARYGITFWPTFWGFLAAFSESFGAVLIATGLFYRAACYLLAFTMLTASIGHFVTGNGTPAHALKNLFVAVGAGLIGPGRYSLDAWWASRKQSEVPRNSQLPIRFPNVP